MGMQLSGSLELTGSFTTSGAIVAQTLVVQTITSSITQMSGSNVFGSTLTNTQRFTGSVLVTGSLAVTTTGTELQVNPNGVTLGNVLTDIHNATGSVRVTGSMRITGPSTLTDTLSGTNATLSGYLTAVAPSSIFYGMQIYGASGGARKIFVAGQQGYSDGFTVDYNGSTFTYGFLNGNVGIGTSTPSSPLTIGRVDSSNEGGQIDLCRASDNTNAWGIDVFGNTTTPSLRFVDNVAAAVRMTIAGTGFVGINNSSPSSRLYVQTTAGATKAYDDTTKTNIMVFDDTSMAAGVGGSITFGGYKTAQTNGGNFAAIDGVKENGTAGNEAGVFRVWTANSSGIFGERMRISSTGASTFRVDSNSVFDLVTLNNVSGTSSGTRLKFQNFFGDLAAIRVFQRDNGSLADDGQMEFQVASNSALSTQMTLRNDGAIFLNSFTYNNTVTGGTRNLFIDGTFALGGISSIRASKKNIQQFNSEWIYDLQPVQFNYRKKDEEGNYTEEIHEEINYGLIAEDTAPIADFLINYDIKEDGSKEMVGIEYSRLITPLLKAIQELEARVKELENK